MDVAAVYCYCQRQRPQAGAGAGGAVHLSHVAFYALPVAVGGGLLMPAAQHRDDAFVSGVIDTGSAVAVLESHCHFPAQAAV